jgi:hypothetical protein
MTREVQRPGAARPRRQPEPPATLQAPVVDGPRGSTLLIPSIGGDAAFSGRQLMRTGTTDVPSIAMFSRSRAHVPWQNRIKSDWDRPRQADLAPVGMTAHKQIETAMCGLPVDFRRMGQED